MHSINARTAAYTLALSSLTKAWARFFDCSEQLDGTYTFDALPSMECLSPVGRAYVLLGVIGCLVWGVAVPVQLYTTLKEDASDEAWTADEIESHAWVLLKYKPSRWWFVSRHHASSWLARID